MGKEIIKGMYSYNIRCITIDDGVESIGDEAFGHKWHSREKTEIEEIIIPDSVKSIGKEAFSGQDKLKKIKLPQGLETIRAYMFMGCVSLNSIEIPESVTSIERGAFRGCSSLKELTLPKGLVSIEDYAFYDCELLQELTIPVGVENIGSFALSRCSSLKELKIPDTVISLGDSVLQSNRVLKKLEIGSGIKECGSNICQFCPQLEELKIDDVAEICDTNLAKLLIGVTNLKKFEYREYHLEDHYIINKKTNELLLWLNFDEQIVWPKEITNCNEYSLVGPETMIKRVDWEIFNYNSITTVFYSNKAKIIINSEVNENIITALAVGCFKEVTLNNIENFIKYRKTIFDKKIKVDKHWDNKYNNYGNVNIKDDDNAIVERILYMDHPQVLENIIKEGKIDYGIYDIIIKEEKYPEYKWQMIMYRVFTNKDMTLQLRSDYIKSLRRSVKHWMGALLKNDYNYVTNKTVTQQLEYLVETGVLDAKNITKYEENNNLDKVTKETLLGVLNTEVVKSTKAQTQLENDKKKTKETLAKDRVKVGKFITSKDGKILYKYLNTLNQGRTLSIKIPSTIEVIEKYAFKVEGFAKSETVSRVEGAKGLNEIRYGAFHGCDKFPPICYKNIMVNDYNYAFDTINNRSDEAVHIIDGVYYTNDKQTVVKVDEDLTEVKIIDGVVEIADEAFAHADLLVKVELPNTLKRIGNKAFNLCIELKEIVIPESVERIGMRAFEHCYSLEKVVLPSNINELKEYTFLKCINLTVINIPHKLEKIGEQAFSGCESLTIEKYKGKIQEIGVNAFKNCGEGLTTNALLFDNYQFIQGIFTEELGFEDVYYNYEWYIKNYNNKYRTNYEFKEREFYKPIIINPLKDEIKFDDNSIDFQRGVIHIEEGADISGKQILESNARWVIVYDNNGKVSSKIWTGLDGEELYKGEIRDMLLVTSTNDGPFDYSWYEEIFEGVLHKSSQIIIAKLRLLYPINLSKYAESYYKKFLRANGLECIKEYIDDENVKLIKEYIEIAGFTKTIGTKLIEYSREKGNAEITAMLMAINS